jgi:FkbM family methyltransferase
MSLAERIAQNFWLLKTCRDLPTLQALKQRSWGVPEVNGLGRLRLRGLDQPVLFRRAATDIPVVWELFHKGEYEFIEGWPFRTVLDCGANAGMFLAWAMRATFGQLERYVGVEPDVESFALLEAQARSLGIEDRATLLQAAVWDRDGVVSFDESGPSWGRKVVEGDGRKVRALTLTSILDEAELEHCDLLKLDVEGGELNVLCTVAACAERIDALVVELHNGLDYAWFAATVAAAGFKPAPAGKLFRTHPGAVRCGSGLKRLVASG